MNGLSFLIVVLVLLTPGVSLAFGQMNYPVSNGEQPRVPPARPILKQRSPGPYTSVAKGSGGSQKPFNKEKPQENSPDASLNNQKPMHIVFEGLHAFSEVEMVKAFSERGIGFPKTTVPSSEVLGKGVALVRELLEARGHFQSRVDTYFDEPAGAVVFLLDEGPRVALAEVRFEGNKSFSSAELASRLGESLARFPTMKEGYDSNIFDYCTRDLSNFMRSRGYLQATFGQPTKSIEGCGLVLTIPVQEGVLYRLGEIKIEGAEAVPPETVRAMLNGRKGDIASGEDIGKWLFEDLKKLYGELGYIEYTAEADPDFKAALKGADEGVVDFKVTIEEGHQFRLHAIKFQGSSLPEKELLGLLRIRAGEVFNQRLFEESIDELNKLGRFELIDKDRDADYRTDVEDALIDIVIKVRNKDHGLSLTRQQRNPS